MSQPTKRLPHMSFTHRNLFDKCKGNVDLNKVNIAKVN